MNKKYAINYLKSDEWKHMIVETNDIQTALDYLYQDDWDDYEVLLMNVN